MYEKVGVIGLGRMGLAMAERFQETGLEVVGTDIFEASLAAARKAGIATVGSAMEVFAGSDVVVLSLPTANDVRLVVECLPSKGLGRELYIIDTTSSDPVVTRELWARLAPAGIHLIDAPVSGGFFGARAGTLGIMVGGEEADLDHVRDVLERIAGRISYMGKTGSGHATKLLNNLLAAANLVVASELVTLAEQQGLDASTLIAALNSGTARNSATEFNYPKWILGGSYDSGFSMKLMRKDVRLADQLASISVPNLPVLKAVAGIWADSEATVADAADFNLIVSHHPTKQDKAQA